MKQLIMKKLKFILISTILLGINAISFAHLCEDNHHVAKSKFVLNKESFESSINSKSINLDDFLKNQNVSSYSDRLSFTELVSHRRQLSESFTRLAEDKASEAVDLKAVVNNQNFIKKGNSMRAEIEDIDMYFQEKNIKVNCHFLNEKFSLVGKNGDTWKISNDRYFFYNAFTNELIFDIHFVTYSINFLSKNEVYSNTYKPQNSILMSKISNGIANSFVNFDFSLFPNPSNGDIKLKLSGLLDEKIEYKVYDLIGNEVYKDIIRSHGSKIIDKELKLEFLNSGHYFIVLNNLGINYTRKFSIIN